jgi:hypothetical protein
LDLDLPRTYFRGLGQVQFEYPVTIGSMDCLTIDLLGDSEHSLEDHRAELGAQRFALDVPFAMRDQGQFSALELNIDGLLVDAREVGVKEILFVALKYIDCRRNRRSVFELLNGFVGAKLELFGFVRHRRRSFPHLA